MSLFSECLLFLSVCVVLKAEGLTTIRQCLKIGPVECFGTPVRYNTTTYQDFHPTLTEKQFKEDAPRWRALAVFPYCWNTAKLFLCQVYFPECVNNTIYPPCKYLCLRTRSSCEQPIPFTMGKWPEWMDCQMYSSKQCNANFSITPFNGSKCSGPFIETSHKLNWFNKIEGCGLSCNNLLYNGRSKRRIRQFIALFGLLSVMLTLTTLSTFLIDWKAQSRYPAVIIFYTNCCFCVASCGWLIQFIGNVRERIICREDGTLRTGEPISESGSGWCLFTFIMIYSFSTSGILWFVMLCYAWHLSFKSLGTTKDLLSGKTAYFHLLAWILPVVFTVIILGMERVDANNLHGICFVSHRDSKVREVLVFAPAATCSLIGNFYLILGLRSLYRVWKQNPSFMNGKAAYKIKATMARIAVFAVLSLLFVWTSIACHIYERRNRENWDRSTRDYLRCLAVQFANKSRNTCRLLAQPSVGLIQLQSFSLFGASITVSSWTWTKATLKTWKRAWTRFRGFDVRKKLQLSLYRRQNRRKIVPLVRQSIPAAAIVVPTSQIHRRVSLSSRGSCQSPKSLPRRMASFLSHVTSDINSSIKWKLKGDKEASCTKGDPFVPVILRPREGRRGTLLSIESILTTSSNGLHVMRRGSQQWSQTSGSEYNRAFGHIYPAKAQIHNVQCNKQNSGTGLTSSNLRVIRMGEDKLDIYVPGMCQRNLSSESDISNSEERDSYIEPETSVRGKEHSRVESNS